MIPSNAVVAGEDIDGTTIYVGRAEHNGEFNPAKVIPSKQVAYIPYGGEEIQTSDYQVVFRHIFKYTNRFRIVNICPFK